MDMFIVRLAGVTEDDYMRRMEVVYCSACDTHIPVVFSSVQQHLRSVTHLKCKVVTKYPVNILTLQFWLMAFCLFTVWFVFSSKAYKDQLKRDSVVTAKAIINNDNVKVRYEMYMKVMTFVAYFKSFSQ